MFTLTEPAPIMEGMEPGQELEFIGEKITQTMSALLFKELIINILLKCIF